MSNPLKVFITYAHKNEEAKNRLKMCLAVMESEGKIKLWDDNEILPGDEWYKDISNNLTTSDMLLYLVSTASLASKNCNKELAEALNANIRVIPVILENCDWLNHQLSTFQVLPDKGLPINKWQPEGDGWQNVVGGIRKTVEEMQTQISDSVQKGTLPEWAFQQGNFLMMLGHVDKAIEAYSHVIELNRDDADAYNNRGVAYYFKEQYDFAIVDFNKVMQLKPENVTTYNNRGNTYVKKSEYNRAIEDFNKGNTMQSRFCRNL